MFDHHSKYIVSEERLAKLEREVKEIKAAIGTKALFTVKDMEETVVERKSLDIPTFKRRNIRIYKGGYHTIAKRNA